MLAQPQVNQVSFPAHCSIAGLYRSPHLADAFAARLSPDASGDPETLARFVFTNQPSWAVKLMRIRDAIVARFGLKTSAQLTAPAINTNARRIGIFRIYSVNETEIVLGEDDRHLDFRISITCTHGAAPENSRLLTVATVVNCHNLLGRAYIFVIVPFHRMIVKASLRRAARAGWPRSAG